MDHARLARVSARISPAAMSRVSSGLGNFARASWLSARLTTSFRPGASQGRAGPKEEAQILRRFGFGMNCVRGAEKQVQSHHRREPASRRSEKGLAANETKPKRADTRRIIKRKHVVNVAIRLFGENLLAHGAFY